MLNIYVFSAAVRNVILYIGKMVYIAHWYLHLHVIFVMNYE